MWSASIYAYMFYGLMQFYFYRGNRVVYPSIGKMYLYVFHCQQTVSRYLNTSWRNNAVIEILQSGNEGLKQFSVRNYKSS